MILFVSVMRLTEPLFDVALKSRDSCCASLQVFIIVMEHEESRITDSQPLAIFYVDV